MIIKSIYINHFGCLKNKHIDFEKGINVIQLPNESGKSTIAEFIRVMLYGVNSLRFNQRKKYMPFGCTSMGGEMTIAIDGTDYIISRTFGVRKAQDSIDVKNALTGASVREYCLDNAGAVMCGISDETFENTCYIKQLSARIDNLKSAEIQSKLINLIQNSNEEYSYRNASAILDGAIRDLKGPKGKINQIQNILNDLAVKTAEKKKIKYEYDRVKLQLQKLEGTTFGKASKLLWLGWIPFLLSSLSVVFVGAVLLWYVLVAIFGIFGILCMLRLKSIDSAKLKQAQQKGFYQSKLEFLKKQYDETDVSKTEEYKQKLQHYNKVLVDITDAKSALEKAFYQLQTDYVPRLNKMACKIFADITDGKYIDFMVDDDYNITVRDADNQLVSAEYLSGGTFDQIYFALRMALVELVAENMPVILDDTFALYDDERMKKALNYLKTIKNQVLIFSCQTREKKFMEEC